MSTRESELEDDRRNRLDEAACDQEGSIADVYRPGTFGCHELLDRLSTIARFLDNSPLSHPALLLEPVWYATANRAVDLLNDLYQHFGAKHLGHPDASEPREKGQLS